MSTTTAPTVPPVEVIRIWNTLAEDHGPLEQVLIEFAWRLLEAAANHPGIPDSSTTP